MPAQPPRLSLLDQLIREFDRGLRTVAAANVAARPSPAGAAPESVHAPQARRHAAALMRVNHAGEIAAQALYHGQALTARNGQIRESLLDAARDETDPRLVRAARTRARQPDQPARAALVRGLVRDRGRRRPGGRPGSTRCGCCGSSAEGGLRDPIWGRHEKS